MSTHGRQFFYIFLNNSADYCVIQLSLNTCFAFVFRLFPPFDLVKVVESNTAVLKRLTQNQGLSSGFNEKYQQLFEDYLQQKAYRELYQT